MSTNDRIERDKQVALETLEPSQKDLDHGLELHKEFIVFDSYGFSPTSVPDSGVLANAIEARAWPNELQDLKEEMSVTRHLTDPTGLQSYKEAWEASGVTCVFQNGSGTVNRIDLIIKRHARFTHRYRQTGRFPLQSRLSTGYRTSQTGRPALPLLFGQWGACPSAVGHGSGRTRIYSDFLSAGLQNDASDLHTTAGT